MIDSIVTRKLIGPKTSPAHELEFSSTQRLIVDLRRVLAGSELLVK